MVDSSEAKREGYEIKEVHVKNAILPSPSVAVVHEAKERVQQHNWQHKPNSEINPSPSSSSKEIHHSISFYSTLRKTVTPYLPPPVVFTLEHHLDPWLRPYTGEEGTFKVVVNVLLGYILLRVIRLIGMQVLGQGKAIVEDDEEELHRGLEGIHYDHTVLICGPSYSGKTRLFYSLCYNETVQTVASIKANVAVRDNLRYIDWPGQSSLYSKLLEPVLHASPRIVFVMDSTQPVATAADGFHALFSYYHATYLKARQRPSTPPSPMSMLVLCHKSDLPTAKNEKRIQLQLRGELERLLKTKHAASSTSSLSSTREDGDDGVVTSWWPVGEPIDLFALKFMSLTFRTSRAAWIFFLLY